MDWKDLIGRSRPEEVAALLLQHLDWESDERLFNLGLDDLEFLHGCFESLAREELARLDLSASDREEIGAHPLLLAQTALEEQGQIACAAALYALAHDRKVGLLGNLPRYEALFLRFKLGHALLLLDEEDEENLRRCAELARRTIRNLEKLWGSREVPKTAFRTLMFKLQSWWGYRLQELGEVEPAVKAFCDAALEAGEVDDRLSSLLSAASLLEKRGEPQRAYRLLEPWKDEAAQLRDPETLEFWEMLFRELRLTLGGDLRTAAKEPSTPWTREISAILSLGLMQDELPNPEEVRYILRQLEERLSQTPEDDASTRHQLMTQLAVFGLASGQTERAAEYLNQAERLEAQIDDDLPVLERQWIVARWKSQSGDSREAVRIFSSLLSGVGRLDLSRRLELFGNYLEALAKETSSPGERVLLEVADRVPDLLDELMRSQPGSTARRRVRDLCQRSLESALIALLSAAERLGVDSAAGQEVLARAWALVMASRNPELRTTPVSDRDRWAGQDLRELEDTFHAALRRQLFEDPSASDPGWRKPLDRLYDYEMAILQAPRAPVRPGSELRPQSTAIAFFQFRVLLTSRPLFVLVCRDGRFGVHWIFQAEQELIEPLRRWGGRRPDADRRGLSRHLSASDPETDEAAATALKSPEDLLTQHPLFPTSLLAREPESPPPCAWYVFPEGPLHGVSVEGLPDWTTPGRVLGERFPIRLCLRREASPSWEEKLDLSRGWLGLGGASYEYFDPLPGTREEILWLEEYLRRQGFPADTLLGEVAHAGNLAARLAERRPAVLHLAVHGYSHPEYPDACALILAPAPDTRANELLPFRQILRLPLEGVQLVVLSACSSLVGPTTKSAGMEGLAWAFLQAGAAQVLASRNEVDDRPTCWLMQTFYRHLRDHPSAEALRRTREECLRDPKVGPYQVGLWSLWS